MAGHVVHGQIVQHGAEHGGLAGMVRLGGGLAGDWELDHDLTEEDRTPQTMVSVVLTWSRLTC